MTGALIILCVTALTGLLLFLFHKPQADETAAEDRESADECCGLHEVCEKKARIAENPIYFDDEELDRFAGRDADAYTAQEEEEFRDVLYTLLPSDIEPWGYSLTARGVTMPASIYSEWRMLAAENMKHDA